MEPNPCANGADFVERIGRQAQPTLVRITDMLPDNVGNGQAPKTMRAKSDGSTIAVPPPSKNWKDQMKRHVILSNRDYKVHRHFPSRKGIDSYAFEIRYTVKLHKAAEDSEVIEAIDLKAASLSRNFVKLPPITIPNSANADAVEVLAAEVVIIDKTTGRQSMLAMSRGNRRNGNISRLKAIVPKHPRDVGAGEVSCLTRQWVRTEKDADDGVSWAVVFSIDFMAQLKNPTEDRQVTTGNSFTNYQILWFLQHDLIWL